jgi:S1-C subfamily serine protease
MTKEVSVFMTGKKYIFFLIVAGFIGGVVALTANQLLFSSEKLVVVDSPVNYRTISESSPIFPFSLTEAAEKGSKVVVQISAEESVAMANERRGKDRSRGFFFRDFFDFGYGDNFYRRRGSGSGVIYTRDGYIITNKHVVDFADNITVTLPDKREFKAEKIGTDASTDLAVLKIDASNLPVIDIADSDDTKLGQWVLAIGNPFEFLTSTVTAGIISAKGRNLNVISDDRAMEEFIQTDAAVNPGNSGGALVDAEGRLLGITTAIATPNGIFAGYSFAIPSNLMKKVVDLIIETKSDLNEKPVLGVSAATIDSYVKEEFDIKIDAGVYVVEVHAGSSADAAGIKVGDVITKFNNYDIRTFEDLVKQLNLARMGESIKITIYRNNKFITFSVILKQSL